MIQFSDTETKLINLALNHAAHDGEFANAAVMLFRQLRKRNVIAQQFTDSNESEGDLEVLLTLNSKLRQALDDSRVYIINQQREHEQKIANIENAFNAFMRTPSPLRRNPEPVPKMKTDWQFRTTDKLIVFSMVPVMIIVCRYFLIT